MRPGGNESGAEWRPDPSLPAKSDQVALGPGDAGSAGRDWKRPRARFSGEGRKRSVSKPSSCYAGSRCGEVPSSSRATVTHAKAYPVWTDLSGTYIPGGCVLLLQPAETYPRAGAAWAGVDALPSNSAGH